MYIKNNTLFVFFFFHHCHGSYGDKAPKSSLARMYASLWMIIGMLLMSTITAQISSSITADGLRPLNDVFGSKV